MFAGSFHSCSTHQSAPFSANATRRSCSYSRRLCQQRLQPCHVLAPLERPACEPSTSQSNVNAQPRIPSQSWWQYVSGTTTSVTTQLLGSFRFWPDSGKAPGIDVNASPTQLSPTDQVLHEAARRTKEEQQSVKPVDIARYLRAQDRRNVKQIRILSSLTAWTYAMHKLTPRTLRRRYKLELVTTSRACERCVYEHSKSAEEVVVEGDGMTASMNDIQSQYAQLVPVEQASNIVAIPRELKFGTVAPKTWSSPAELVQQKLAEAASMASAAAMSPINTVVKATQNLVVAKTSANAKVTVEQNTTTKVASVPPASSIPEAAATVGSNVVQNPDDKRCPSEWFVCDDPEKQIRYFAIQGSDTVDHWVTNLTFEPITFEDPSLGVKVHRGVYAAALALYDKFIPLVQEQLDSSPFARVCFVGHSIGGSLAMLLMLMYVRRGVVPPDRVAPVHTFGAPAIFCEGALGGCSGNCGSCTPECQPGSADHRSLLVALGLRTSDVVNVIMHRDIVPRAFACDYSPVADILKSWGPAFREHCCLGPLRPLLYNHVGRMVVLQPDAAAPYVAKDPYHPMLPQQAGLWELREPHVRKSLKVWERPEQEHSSNQVSSLREAVLALMDNPHPLEILYDTGAYGPFGSISRYHNPDNYTMALATLVRRTMPGRSSTQATDAAQTRPKTLGSGVTIASLLQDTVLAANNRSSTSELAEARLPVHN